MSPTAAGTHEKLKFRGGSMNCASVLPLDKNR